MNRETTTERLLAIKEQLLEIAGVVNQIAMRVDILWEERQRRRVQGPREDDRQ